MSEAYWEKYRSTVDRQIEQSGLADGLGDNPYKGRPLADSGRPYRENWWLDGYLRREGVSADTHLPVSLRLRREIERIDEAATAKRSEREVRALADDLNGRIAEWRRAPTPPHVPLSTVDVDGVVARWRASREGRGGSGDSGSGDTGSGESGRRGAGDGAPAARRRGRSLLDRLRGRGSDG